MGLFKRQTFGATKFTGDFTYSDFTYGLYNLDTPRSMGEQLRSLAITGGRNVWTERGALVSQYGYDERGQFDEGDIPYLVSSDNSQSNNIFILCDNGKVYYYTTLDGLKKYATSLDFTEPIIAHNGRNLYLYIDEDSYMFGGCYNDSPGDSDFEEIIHSRTARGEIGYDNIINVDITEEELQYFWLDKQVVYIEDGDTEYKTVTVNAIRPLEDDPTYSYTLSLMSTEAITLTDNISIGEKALHELCHDPEAVAPLFPEMYWEPEDGTGLTEDVQAHFLKPKMMAVALNRLWVVDETNTIFYSSVGALTDFRQSMGAGYFRGFYNDTSEILSLEEFYSGVLIVKQTGMYHVKLTTEQYSYGEVATSTDENYIRIEKLNNIIQRYPGDHVIIGSEVIAFDAASGNLVQAAYVNYLGGLQEGSVLLHGSELDSQSLGLQSASNRVLAYSFQEEVLLLYYGDKLDKALLITRGLSLFPRENSKLFLDIQMFAQGFINLTTDGYIIEDFKRGTIIPDVTPVAEFEPLCLRGNNMLCGAIIEVTELNGVRYKASTLNAGSSEQDIVPPISQITTETSLPNFIYSDLDRNFLPASFAETSRWASQKANVTRFSAPLGGRNGMTLTLEFEPNVSFCLLALRYPDMSQGE